MSQRSEYDAVSSCWRVCCKLSWAVGMLAAFLICGVARAADEAGPCVVVAFNPTDAASASAATAIQSHLSGLGVSVVVEPLGQEGDVPRRLVQSSSLAAAHHALGAFTIDTSAAGELLVFFAGPEGDAALIRRIRPKPPLDRVALEEAGNVVRSLVEALLEGGRVGIGVVADAPSKTGVEGRTAPVSAGVSPETAAAALPRDGRSLGEARDAGAGVEPRRHLGATLRYAGTSFAVGQPWQSGMALGLRVYLFQDWFVGGGYAFFPRTTNRVGPTRMALDRHPAEIAVGYQPVRTLSPTCELAVLADRVIRRTLDAEDPFESTPEQGRWLFGVAARAGGCWSPWPAVHGCLLGGVDVLLGRLSYVVGSRDPESHVVLRTLRPRVELGLGADFL